MRIKQTSHFHSVACRALIARIAVPGYGSLARQLLVSAGIVSLLGCTTLNPTQPVVQESALLVPSEGFVGDKLGVSVDQITTNPDTGVQTITLSVPKEVGEIQSVDVVDAADRPLPMARDAKILQDYENNNVGVRLFLAPKSNVQFKLKLSTEQ